MSIFLEPRVYPDPEKCVDLTLDDNALIKKAATSPLAAVTCPTSRFYVQVD
jgi:hypothetical protein